VEDRVEKMDQYLACCHRADHGHQTPWTKKRQGISHTSQLHYWDGEIYCTAGFGSISDWYRNILVNPDIELWLPVGKRNAHAGDISDSPKRLFLLRQVIIASGFADLLFGINQKKLNDEQMDALSKNYRLIHFKT